MDAQNLIPQIDYVYKAVRPVGILKPKFDPKEGRVFSDGLDVIGTAFWLKETKVLLTCAHVVERLINAPVELAGLLVIGNQGNYARASVGAVDFIHDLAILRLEAPQDLIDAESATGLEIADSYPGIGEKVSYSGFPLGLKLLDKKQDPTYAEGVIGAALRDNSNRKQIQITGPAVGGFSGSPVVIKSQPSKLIGVLSNGPAAAEHIFMAISFEHVRAISNLAIS